VAARTTFIIAHRLSTVRRCDRILVLRDGAIVEMGAPAELEARDGDFGRLVHLQQATELQPVAEPPTPNALHRAGGRNRQRVNPQGRR
jgi:ABC-type multidrug transport system ATPase subunit